MTYSQDTSTKYDKKEIKAAAQGRELEILRSVAGIDESYLDGKHHPCPKCGGTDRFRLIDAKAGAVLCNQCFRTENGDFIAAVKWMKETSFPDALAMIADHLFLDGENIDIGTGNRSGDCQEKAQRNIEEIPDQKETDQTAYLERCAAWITETDYLRNRGISDETAKKYGVGYDDHFSEGTGGKVWRVIIFPNGTRGAYNARNTAPYASKEDRYRKHGDAGFFHADALANPTGPVFVTEG